MPEAPLTGVLTFLFTDLEGSTPLWERHPQLMQVVSARHDELLQGAFETHGGRIVKKTGDGFHVAFESPSDAIAAALAGQQALAAEAWPQEIGTLKVRMGLHAGESRAREGDYYGPELNRAARIMGLGYGGQVLVSGATVSLLRGRLPEGGELIDLGLHRLKGLSDPEPIYQLVHASLRRDFPPLQSVVTVPHNLPTQLTTFIGRTGELEEVKRLVEGNRLLTLLGPGGTGKTRLMFRAADDLIEHFVDGIWLVELAPLADPELVIEAAAGVLGVRGHPDRSLADSLAVYLRRKAVLLLLDNVEHLIQASAELAEALLTSCPQVKLLVTSREPLAIRGETTFQVPTLSVPAEGAATAAELEASEAALMFLERARAVRPDFALTPESIPAVAEIVRRLDGIPLALELAAARLNDRFRLLVSGHRTALPRQQTLRALIDWSWNLLEASEQVLLRRLSVFSGGWTMEAAQQVAGAPPLDEYAVLDALEGLVQKSLVATRSAPGGSDRFYLLETIDQYARERLAEAGEDEALKGRHAAYIVGLVREAHRAETQRQIAAWVKRLVWETDNFRTAFDWLEAHDPLAILAAAGKLMVLGGQGFWSFSPPQARRWLERAIQIGRAAELEDDERQERQMQLGTALGAMASVGFALGRHEEGAAAGAEAIAILRPFGESQPLAYALASYAFNLNFLGQVDEAVEAGEEAREIARDHGYGVELSIALGALGLVTLMRGDIEQARQYLWEGKALIKELGSNWLGPQLLMMEGRLLANTGDMAGAETIYREADQRFQVVGEPTQMFITRSELAHALRGQGKWDEAQSLYRETILFFLDMGHEPAVANQLECFAYIAIAQEEPERAARLLGAAQAIRKRTNTPLNLPWEKAEYDQAMQRLDEILGRAGRDAAMGEGRKLTLDQAVVLARTSAEA